MLYIKDTVTEKQLSEFGFKRCKKPYGQLYYLCLSHGSNVIFIGNGIYIYDWNEDDPRIHKNANCKYRCRDIYMDVLYDMTMQGLIEKRMI